MKKIINIILLSLSLNICASETPWYTSNYYLKGLTQPVARGYEQYRRTNLYTQQYRPIHTSTSNFREDNVSIETNTRKNKGTFFSKTNTRNNKDTFSQRARLFAVKTAKRARNIFATVGFVTVAGAVIAHEAIHQAYTDLEEAKNTKVKLEQKIRELKKSRRNNKQISQANALLLEEIENLKHQSDTDEEDIQDISNYPYESAATDQDTQDISTSTKTNKLRQFYEYWFVEKI